MTLIFDSDSEQVFHSVVQYCAKASYLFILLLFVSRKYQFTFPNIHLANNCNNPVRFLYAQGVWQQPVLHTEIWSHHYQVHLGL